MSSQDKGENWYKLILNSIRDMILVKGPDSKLLWANKSFLDYYGMTEKELKDIVDGPHSSPDHTLQYVRDDQFVFDHQKDLNIPSEPVNRHDGQVQYFHTIKSPIFQGGELTQTVGVSRLLNDEDIQHQELSELDAKVFTAPLRSIIDTLPIASILLDHHCHIIQCNKLWINTFGGEDHYSNKTFVHEYSTMRELEAAIQESLNSGLEQEKLLTIDKNEDEQYYNYKITPWKYPNGDTGGTIILATDVTQIKKKEKALQKSNERYELMIKGASVGIWDWPNVNKNKEYWSPKFYELLGYNDQEIEASLDNFKKLLHPNDHERTFHLVQKHFKGEASFDLLYRLKNKNNEYRWFRGSGQVSRDSEGNPVRMVGSIQDVHERVTTEKELRRSNEELDQFAYIASHDLREPLRGMRNFSQFLVEDYGDKLDDEGLKYLSTIKMLGARLEKYLDSLLYYSRLGREKMAYKKTKINELIEEVKETYTAISPTPIEITMDDEMPELVCDYLKLQKVFSNLIQNSLRYNVSDVKKIHIGHSVNVDGLHKFYVQDNGIGIKKDHWNRIFTIFKRLHTKDKFEGGTGLGLTLVKKAVEKHGGDIWVESSNLDKGTTFAFTLKENYET